MKMQLIHKYFYGLFISFRLSFKNMLTNKFVELNIQTFVLFYQTQNKSRKGK